MRGAGRGYGGGGRICLVVVGPDEGNIQRRVRKKNI